MPTPAETYFSPEARRARYAALQGFADQIGPRWAAVRRERRPLPAHDLNGSNVVRWARAVCGAEIEHANNEFWNLARKHEVAAFIDRHTDPAIHARFHLPHEAAACVALNCLIHLGVEERAIRDMMLALKSQRRAAADATQSEAYRASWAAAAERTVADLRDRWAQRRKVWRAAVDAIAAYRAERALVDAPAMEAA